MPPVISWKALMYTHEKRVCNICIQESAEDCNTTIMTLHWNHTSIIFSYYFNALHTFSISIVDSPTCDKKDIFVYGK